MKNKVTLKGGSIGEPARAPQVFDNEQLAREYAKRMNRLLTPGEKKYYKLRYSVHS